MELAAAHRLGRLSHLPELGLRAYVINRLSAIILLKSPGILLRDEQPRVL